MTDLRTELDGAWYQIATAPKDGTMIAIRFSHGRKHRATWRTTYGGEWHVDSRTHLPWADQHEITHWQPIQHTARDGGGEG